MRNSPTRLLALLALLLPAAALAQPQPGVGWQTAAGARIDYARGNCAGQGGALRKQFDPWARFGDVNLFIDSPADPRYPEFRRLYCLRYDVHADCHCQKGGVAGTSPHGATVQGRLALWYSMQSASHRAQWSGTANKRETEDVGHSSSEWCRLNTAVGIACGSQTTGGCGDGWYCDPLTAVPPELRPGAPSQNRHRPVIEARRDTSRAPSLACYFPGQALQYGVLHVREVAGCFAGLACSTVSQLNARGAACWAPPVPAPEPAPDVRVEVGPCVTGGRVVSVEVDGESGGGLVTERFSTVLSTGRSVEVLVPVCPPEVRP